MILKILYSSMKKKKELSVSIPENDIEKLHYSIFRTTTLQKLKVEYKNKEKNIQELAIIFKDNWYKEKKCNPVYIIK
jgi:ribosome recycling factor|tara:strand:- start:734 stop:964 length:231 start_codon:yes stop_codon:yes gene_type:complete